MLTFLRIIRKSLIESGSARKCMIYAIGEIALVVIGILLALQKPHLVSAVNNNSGTLLDLKSFLPKSKELQSEILKELEI